MTKPLIIFDCDGVLVDSEPLAKDVVLELIAEAGYIFSETDYYQHLLGKSRQQDVATLRNQFAIQLAVEDLEQSEQRLLARFTSSLKPTPGIVDLLAQLDCDACVASSSSLGRIDLSLTVTGLRQYFANNIFSASMVANGKPAPDLFLHAAASMGYLVEQCIVIEDSPSGIQAAQAAGMLVIAFLGGGHAKPAGLESKIAALKPDAVIHNMLELPKYYELSRS